MYLWDIVHRSLGIILVQDNFCVIRAKISLAKILLHGEADCRHAVASEEELFDERSKDLRTIEITTLREIVFLCQNYFIKAK